MDPPVDPAPLARHYSRFRVSERLLLTGHSHQAWPDVGFEAQQRAWLDAAELVDEKWGRAEEMAGRVRAGFARLLDDVPERIALGASTHELLVRLLSCLPLRVRPRIVTTDGEFHSARRQLDRLAEEGVPVVKVAALPADTLAERLAAQVDDDTSLVVVSAVLFGTGHIVPGLDGLVTTARARGADVLVDAYHALGAIPFELPGLGLGDAFVTGGGYKYLQLGEGNCFLRIPPDRTDLRPAITGWYAEFGTLSDGGRASTVPYADGPARFAGSTYDPTSHYRAAAVFDFFAEQGLTAAALRATSLHQTRRLTTSIEFLDADPAVMALDRTGGREARGGFLAVRSPFAGELQAALRSRGVWSDHRGEVLRLGPAPYLSDRQLDDAAAALGEVLRAR